MAWLQPALDFLGRIPAEEDRPIWCFSVGGVTPRGPVTRRMTALEVRKVQRQFPAGLRLRGHRFFGGIVEMAGVPLWGRIFWRVMGGRPGDHRDWRAVDSWADQLAAALQVGRSAAGSRRDEIGQGRGTPWGGTSATPPPTTGP
jgi:menaquinone-dependent protoporphyrinogen oxidase